MILEIIIDVNAIYAAKITLFVNKLTSFISSFSLHSNTEYV